MLLLMIIASQLLAVQVKGDCGTAKVLPNENKLEAKKDLYIFQGEDVPSGMFPWIGYLVYGQPNKYAECTATLVRPRWLVTAAHCVLGECAKDAWVILGTVKRENLRKKNMYKVAYLFHPKIVKYQGKRAVPMHDIAMIKLEKAVDISGSNGTINTICLPKPEQNLAGRVYLSGWGLTAEDAINPADSLKYIPADILVNATCFPDDTTKFCVRGSKNEQTPFKGDSGGPAQMLIDGKYYLHGALSGGNKTISLYTIVKDYLNWILNLPQADTVNLRECKTQKGPPSGLK